MRQKILFLFALLCAVVQGAWADDTYAYPTKTKPEFYASYGGKSNVVVINTAAELAYITEHFDEDSKFPVEDDDWSELNYYLNADINMGNSYSWLPLGRESYTVTKYEGTFWGNGHTITYMIRGLDEENQGLFATIHEDGKVYDVNVVCDIYTERDFVGGIAGENYGLIENCTVTANIESNHDDVGGIVGHNLDTGTVKGCHVTGLVKGTGSAIRIGGIAGRNNHDIDGAGHPYYGTIVNCWVEADVSSECPRSDYPARLGGICGLNFANVSYCCMTGNVSHASGNSEVGAIAGSSDRSDHDVSNCTFYGILTNNYNLNNIYVGDKGDTMENMYDTFNQAEYDDAVSKGHALYAYAIRNVFALSVTTTGTGTVTVSDFNAETIDYDKVPTGHWIYVYITSGVVSSFIVKDADDNDVEVTRYHQYGDNYYMFPMPRSNVSVTVNFTTQQGDGSEENPYVISTAEDWEAFAKKVNDGESYEGKFVMLGGDFEVSTYQLLGNNIGFSNAFKGTFDGNGHTLTCVYPPFTRVMDATIKNLHVTGNATGSSEMGSIVRYSKGTLNLINCRSSVNVDCGTSQGYGGLVGTLSTDATGTQSTNPNSVTIEGCVFDGSINSTVTNEYRAHDCSGFVGDAGTGGTVIIRNSLLKPASVGTGILSNTFAKMGNNGTLTIENSYFVATDNLPANQGTQARTVSAGEGVTLSGLGTATKTYGTNGITAYAHGIRYGGNYYAGSGEAVTLNVSHGVNSGYTFSQYTATNGGTLANAATSTPTLTMPAADVTIGIEWTKNTASLFDNADNTTFINSHDGDVYDITLAARTLYKDGAWNTICLPFDVTIAGSPLAGATARALTSASISGSTLTLTFGDAVTTLEAGTPYIIKWTADANYVDDDAHNIVSPVFSGVTIDADADGNYDTETASPAVTTDERVRFLGTYKSTAFDAEDKSILLMGAANTLYYPTTGAGIGAQRAYFKVGGEGALLARRLTSFSIDFGDGEATGIISTTNYTNDTNSDAWFTLDGRKLDGKPTQRGIYINNGKKVAIK